MTYALTTRGDPFVAPRHFEGKQGDSLEAMAVRYLPQFPPEVIQIRVNGDLIPRGYWAFVRPKGDAIVELVAMPHGKEGLRAILQIAVAVAAFAIGGPAAGAKAWTTFQVASVTAINIAGSLLINKLIPLTPKLPDLSGTAKKESPTLLLSGASNDLQPYRPIARVLGRHKMVPPLGAKTFTEVVGNDHYLRMLVVWGYGPLAIEDIKIGDTPIENFDAVEVETRYGFPYENPLYLFPGQVHQENLSIDLKNGAWHSRTTGLVDEISLDITFPRGLGEQNTRTGDIDALKVTVKIQYRPQGVVGSWRTAPDIVTERNQTSAVLRTSRWQVPQGRYDVRVRRVGHESTNIRAVDNVLWSSLRGFVSHDPITMSGLAKTALRIKATGQLNGQIKNLNAIVTSKVKAWDSAKRRWAVKATNNPAALFREVLQGPATDTPVDDDRLDIENLQAFSELCEQRERTCNLVVDYSTTQGEILQDVAAAGRGNPAVRYNRWGVITDEPNKMPVQMITPRNSWGFSASLAYPVLPDAFRVRYIDEDDGWEQKEELTPLKTGKVLRKIEDIDFAGITTRAQAVKMAQYHAATLIHRRETVNVNMDVEHIVCSRGDLVVVGHEGIAKTYLQARVVETTVLKGEVTSVRLDESMVLKEGTAYGLQWRSGQGTVSGTARLAVGDGTQTNGFTLATPTPKTRAPAVGDLCVVGTVTQTTQRYFVQEIRPSHDLTAQLTLVPEAPQVWEESPGLTPVFRVPDRQDAHATPQVMRVRSDESVLHRTQDGSLLPRMVVELAPPASGTNAPVGIQTRLKKQGEDWHAVMPHSVEATELYFEFVEQGITYTMALRYVYGNQDTGPWLEQDHTVIGKTTKPPMVQNLRAKRRADRVQLDWDAVEAPDLVGYEVRQGEDWESALLVAQKHISTTLTHDPKTLEEVTYLVRAVDQAGLVSEQVASLTTRVLRPAIPTNFHAYQQGEEVRFTWDAAQEQGLEYEVRQGRIWHAGQTIGVTASTELQARMVVTSQQRATFMVRAKRAGGLTSSGEARVAVTLYPIYAARRLHQFKDLRARALDNTVMVDGGLELVPGKNYGSAELSVNLPKRALWRCFIEMDATSLLVNELPIHQATMPIESMARHILPVVSEKPLISIYIYPDAIARERQPFVAADYYTERTRIIVFLFAGAKSRPRINSLVFNAVEVQV